MKFKSISIKNFRAIDNIEINDMKSLTVIAGPNGCGKSTIFDAIRLVKSVYGGYQPNEWQHWMSEFQINFNNKKEIESLFQNKNMSIIIQIVLCMSETEKEYLEKKSFSLLVESAWKEKVPELRGYSRLTSFPLAAQLSAYETEVNLLANARLPEFISQLNSGQIIGNVELNPTGDILVSPSIVLETIFSIYDPSSIGVIDYHGAQRTYNREQIGGINLNIETNELQKSQHALYNYSNKYSNVKSELATAYIRDLLAKEAGSKTGTSDSMISTLNELFEHFFPGKQFLGPQPTADGRLLFNVKTKTGVHDINEMSSGEKELLYGYLRLRNSAPNNSILLIDEPELHLNPRLIDGLLDFYYKHLSKNQNNQMILVTHSDAILRQAVGKVDFSLYHMQLPSSIGDGNQLKEVSANDEVEKIVIDLVGDLAVYKPGSKIVILEGGGDSDVDLKIVSNLFPEFSTQVNLISGGNKTRVRELYSTLDLVQSKGVASLNVFSINDMDSKDFIPEEGSNQFIWDRYHIENYLIEDFFLLEVAKDLDIKGAENWSESDIREKLIKCAKKTKNALVKQKLEEKCNGEMIQCINVKISPNSKNISSDIQEAVNNSFEKIKIAMTSSLSKLKIKEYEKIIDVQFDKDLKNEEWRKTFRGRDVLKQATGEIFLGKLSYEVLRNLLIAKMKSSSFKPNGMFAVIKKIMEK